MGFELQDYFSLINLKSAAIVICLDSADADYGFSRHFEFYGIKSYQTYISKISAPFTGITSPLRVAIIEFMGAKEAVEMTFPLKDKEQLRKIVKEENASIHDEEFISFRLKWAHLFCMHCL